MINEIKIENYKCFKNFQLTNLKQLNIIVGENGVGKSALLEYIKDLVCLEYANNLDEFINPAKYSYSAEQFVNKNYLLLQKIFYPDLIDLDFIHWNDNFSKIKFEKRFGTQTIMKSLRYMDHRFQKDFIFICSFQFFQNISLIIDEIENEFEYFQDTFKNIYYNRNMPLFWEMLLLASKEFNVQLFITTHSYEMLEYLQKAIENQPQEDKTYWQEQLNLICLTKHIK